MDVQELYREWPGFIVPVQPTLREFVFEHGREPKRLKVHDITTMSNMSPMEDSFMRYLILAISSGGWQCSEVMIIDGVEKLRVLKNNPYTTRRKRLRGSLGDTVTLLIGRNSTSNVGESLYIHDQY